MNFARGIRLKYFSVAFPVAIVVFLSIIGAALWLVISSFQQVQTVLDERQQTLALTSEFSGLTSLQARLVRAYAATADTRFLTYYYELAEYRNGRTAAPAADPVHYWEEVIAGLRPPVAVMPISGQTFAQRMRDAGFSSDELGALARALAIGDELQETEQIAFAATQGLYDPVKRDFVSDGQPNMQFALGLVYGSEYAELQAHLTSQVSRLAQLADARTKLSVELATHRLRNAVVLAGCAIGMLLTIALLASMFIERYVLRPIQNLAPVTHRIAAGDYQTRLAASEAVAELNTVASAFNNMAAAIEEDVKQRVAVTRELEEARALAESATKAKSMFLANMSHEVRTPMNAIIGMAHLTLKTRLDTRQRDYVSKIHSAGKSLLGVINDILDFSKIEANKLELERVAFDLQQVVSNTVFMVRESAIEKQIELLVDMDPALVREPKLTGDGLRLGEVLTNLLSNAVKFTHQGYVRLSVGLADQDDHSRGVRFSVADTGIGMTAEQRSRLFHEFNQADGSTTRKYGGTGLGLAISKRLVDLMGGSIDVQSEPGQGSCFSFCIRLGKAEAPANRAKTIVPGGRVLVVDDSPEARLVLTRMLEDQGCEVMSAKDAAEALTVLHDGVQRGRPFSMAFIDWVMPGMDGGALIGAIRSRFGSKAPRLLVVSAYDTDGLREAIDRLGVEHFLPKPVLPSVLEQLFSGIQVPEAVAKPAPAVPAETQTARPDMQVLLVEDHPINQQLTLHLLREMGIVADLAQDGQEAISRIQQHPPGHYSLVLMDLQMPVLDGYEASRRLLADSRFADLPIVALTAHVIKEERDRCLAMGMRDHLGKPIDPEELARLVERFRPRDRRQTLPDIDGLDVHAGLQYTGGKPDLYLSLLRQFVEQYHPFAQEIDALLGEGRHANARRAAHGLKAVAESLGAYAVANAASVLELELSRGKPSQDCLQALMLALAPLLASLKAQLLPTDNQDATSHVEAVMPANSPAPMPSWLTELRQLLSEGDVGALRVWREHAQELSSVVSMESYGRVRRALENFEFDVALEALPAAPGGGESVALRRAP
jgi:signal transduction histidine kinase/CheY-like chemotaxis protein